MLACAGGHIKVAVMLFEKGASIDSKDNGGSCCLHWAVDGGNTACIQWLLDNGIDVWPFLYQIVILFQCQVVFDVRFFIVSLLSSKRCAFCPVLVSLADKGMLFFLFGDKCKVSAKGESYKRGGAERSHCFYFYNFLLTHFSTVWLPLFTHLAPWLKKAIKLYLPSLLFLIYKHYAIDIADPSSMQDVYHMNLAIDLAHSGVCGSVVEHWSAESKGLRFDSSWGLRIFSLSHTCDKTKKNLSIFLYWVQKLPSLLFSI